LDAFVLVDGALIVKGKLDNTLLLLRSPVGSTTELKGQVLEIDSSHGDSLQPSQRGVHRSQVWGRPSYGEPLSDPLLLADGRAVFVNYQGERATGVSLVSNAGDVENFVLPDLAVHAAELAFFASPQGLLVVSNGTPDHLPLAAHFLPSGSSSFNSIAFDSNQSTEWVPGMQLSPDGSQFILPVIRKNNLEVRLLKLSGIGYESEDLTDYPVLPGLSIPLSGLSHPSVALDVHHQDLIVQGWSDPDSSADPELVIYRYDLHTQELSPSFDFSQASNQQLSNIDWYDSAPSIEFTGSSLILNVSDYGSQRWIPIELPSEPPAQPPNQTLDLLIGIDAELTASTADLTFFSLDTLDLSGSEFDASIQSIQRDPSSPDSFLLNGVLHWATEPVDQPSSIGAQWRGELTGETTLESLRSRLANGSMGVSSPTDDALLNLTLDQVTATTDLYPVDSYQWFTNQLQNVELVSWRNEPDAPLQQFLRVENGVLSLPVDVFGKALQADLSDDGQTLNLLTQSGNQSSLLRIDLHQLPLLDFPSAEVRVDTVAVGSEADQSSTIFRVQRSGGDLFSSLDVPFSLRGSASAGQDYLVSDSEFGIQLDVNGLAKGVVRFKPGELTKLVELPTVTDSLVDAGETVELFLLADHTSSYSLAPAASAASAVIVAEQLGSLSLESHQRPGLKGSSSYPNDDALAILRSDSSLVAWGLSGAGGNIPSDIDLDGTFNDLHVLQVASTDGAISVLRSDGQVFSWGDVFDGAGLNESSFGPRLGFGKTQHIYASTNELFLLQDDGDLYNWRAGIDKKIGENIDQVFVDSNRAIYIQDDGSLSSYYSGSSNDYIFNIPKVLTSAFDSDFSPVVDVVFAKSSYAALRLDGSVITWGDTARNGSAELLFADTNVNGIADPLESGVVKLTGDLTGGGVFSALKDDGSLYVWGGSTYTSPKAFSLNEDYSVANSGKDIHFVDILDDFTAISSDGQLVAYTPYSSADSPLIKLETTYYSNGWAQIKDRSGFFRNPENPVIDVYTNTEGGSAALRLDGSVIAWGDSSNGGFSLVGDEQAKHHILSLGSAFGDPSELYSYSPVVSVASSAGAFAALRLDGSVITWGSDYDGGTAEFDLGDANNDLIADVLESGVVSLHGFHDGFIALKDDGGLVRWSRHDSGSYSSPSIFQQKGYLDRDFDGDGLTADDSAPFFGDLQITTVLHPDNSLVHSSLISQPPSDFVQSQLNELDLVAPELPAQWIRQNHLLADLLPHGSQVNLEQLSVDLYHDQLYFHGIDTAESPSHQFISLAELDKIPVAQDEQLVIRYSDAYNFNFDGDDQPDVLISGVIQKDSVEIAGGVDERPLLQLLHSDSTILPQDLNLLLEGQAVSARGNDVTQPLNGVSSLWITLSENDGAIPATQNLDTATTGLLITGNASSSSSPKEADPLLSMMVYNPSEDAALAPWQIYTPLIWNDIQLDETEDGFYEVELSELSPTGSYNGAIHLFDADGLNSVFDDYELIGDQVIEANDLVITGFSTSTRRDASGQNLAIPQTNVYLYAGTAGDLISSDLTDTSDLGFSIDPFTPIYRDAGLDLYGLANGTISSGDVDGDGDNDLLLNGEDFFALPANENAQADGQGGGNPVSLIFRNLRLSPVSSGISSDVAFENALFTSNPNDQRWASFDYNFDAEELRSVGPTLNFTSRPGVDGDQHGVQMHTPLSGWYNLDNFDVVHNKDHVNGLSSSHYDVYQYWNYVVYNGPFYHLTDQVEGHAVLELGEFEHLSRLLSPDQELILQQTGSFAELTEANFGVDLQDYDDISDDWETRIYSPASDTRFQISVRSPGVNEAVPIAVFSTDQIALKIDHVPFDGTFADIDDELLIADALFTYQPTESFAELAGSLQQLADSLPTEDQTEIDFQNFEASMHLLADALRSDLADLGGQLQMRMETSQEVASANGVYELDSLTLSSSVDSGLYELELSAVDHKRSGLNEIQSYSEFDSTAISDLEFSSLIEGSENPLAEYLSSPDSYLMALGEATLAAENRIYLESSITNVSNLSALLTTDPKLLGGSAEVNILGLNQPISRALYEQFMPTIDWLSISDHIVELSELSDEYALSRYRSTSTPSSQIDGVPGATIVSVLQASPLSDQFRLADSDGFLFGSDDSLSNEQQSNSVVVIQDFNPFLDTVQLYEPEDASFVWDQVLYRKDPVKGDHVFSFDEGGNELAAERYLSQPILDSYGRNIVYSYVLQELRDSELKGSLLRFNAIIDGERQPERLVVFEGVDQDLLHFETSFNDGRLQFVNSEDAARQQLRFIVADNGTDSDDILSASDAYTIPFKPSLMGDWLNFEFDHLPDRFGILTGGDGNDQLYGSTSVSTVPVVYLDGGQGHDRLYGSDVDSYVDRLFGQEGDDVIHGLRGVNIIDGGSGDDRLFGGFNNDTLEGGAGSDFLQGGEGFDTASYANDPMGVTVNLSWRTQPVVVLPASGGDVYYLDPDSRLADLTGDLRSLAESIVQSGLMRFDPNQSLKDFLHTVFSDTGLLPIPELFDTSANNPVLLVPSNTSSDVLKLDGSSLVRELDSDARTAVESLLRRAGVAPRATMSLSEASQLAQSDRLLHFGALKVNVTDVSSFGAVDGSSSDDQIATTVLTLPGTSVADATIARDAARLLMIGTDQLQGVISSLTEEHAARVIDPSVDTPTIDSVEGALSQTLNDSDSVERLVDSGIQAGASNDLALWLSTFATVIAELQPQNLSSLSILESLSGVVSQIENIEGSSYGDLLIGDNQNNELFGGSGDDVLIGSKGNDYLHGGTGRDRLYGGEGSDYLEGGGGADVLEGGAGDDRYSLLTPTLTLEDAFRALGGDPQSLLPIERQGESISWEKFRLWADPTRWQGEVQWHEYERLGFIPDRDLYKRAASDNSIGWLLHGQGGTVIRDAGGITGAEDELILQLPATLSLDGPQQGTIGMARGNGTARAGNTDLIIDINSDGILDPDSDLTIEDYFFGAGSGSGAIGAIRQYGLKADYYQGSDFNSKLFTRVDSSVDFDWGYLLPDGSSAEASSGLSARWSGELVPSVQGQYRFRVTTDSQLPSSWELLIDGILITDSDQILDLNAQRSVDLELRWFDEPGVSGSGDHSIRFEWARGEDPFEVVDVSHLRTGTTVTAIDILGSQDLLVPVLNRELFTSETRNWQGSTQWGDIDNDGDLDLLVFSFDDLGNGESQVLINELDPSGANTFTSSFDLPAFERVHSAEWGDWNSDGYLDLLVAGIRTDDDFNRRETVEILINQGGVSFELATPDSLLDHLTETWWNGIENPADPLENTLRASWGDLDHDGHLDLAITNSIDTQVLIVPSGSEVFVDELLAGMEGAQLEFGYFESSDGDASFADRGLAGFEKPERLAEGMDLAVNRSWVGTEYTSVSSDVNLRFWDSESNLFDLQRDLVGLDTHLLLLAPQLGQDPEESDHLLKPALIEINPESTDFDLSYSFYRIDRNVLRTFSDLEVSGENPIGFHEVELSWDETFDIAKQWFTVNETNADSDYTDPGANSELDLTLLSLESEWEYLGDGQYNRNPLNFRYDPDYFYFLEFDTTLLGSLASNDESTTIYQTYTANDLLGRDPGTGPEQHISAIPVSSLDSAHRELIEALLAGSVEVVEPDESDTSSWSVRSRRILDEHDNISSNPIADSFSVPDSGRSVFSEPRESFNHFSVRSIAFVDGVEVERSSVQPFESARVLLAAALSLNDKKSLMVSPGNQNQAYTLEFYDPSSILPFLRVNWFADTASGDGALIQKIDLLNLPLVAANIPQDVFLAGIFGGSDIDYTTSSVFDVSANDVSVDNHVIPLDLTDDSVLTRFGEIVNTGGLQLLEIDDVDGPGVFDEWLIELGYEPVVGDVRNDLDITNIVNDHDQNYLRQAQILEDLSVTRPVGGWADLATSISVVTSEIDQSPVLQYTSADGETRNVDSDLSGLMNNGDSQPISNGSNITSTLLGSLYGSNSYVSSGITTSFQRSFGTVNSVDLTTVSVPLAQTSSIPSVQYLLLPDDQLEYGNSQLDYTSTSLGTLAYSFDVSDELQIEQASDFSFAPVTAPNPFDTDDYTLFGSSVLYGPSVAGMFLFDEALHSAMPSLYQHLTVPGDRGHAQQPQAVLGDDDLISIDGYLNFSDTIHQLRPSVTINLTPLETPLEVVSIDAPAKALHYAEGSLFGEGLIAAFGDVNLGGNVSDLYTSGPAGASISLDPDFITKSAVSNSSIPEQLVSPIKSIGFDLLDRETVEGSSLRIVHFKAGDSLVPHVSSGQPAQAQVGLVREFDLRELLGGDPIIGMTYQIDVKARFGSPDSPLALRAQIVDENGTRLVNRIQDVEIQGEAFQSSDDSQNDDTLLPAIQPFELTDQDTLVFPWSTELDQARALLRVTPEYNFSDDLTSIDSDEVSSVLQFSDVLISAGRLTIPALDGGYATWADVDNDGDQDLLLSGIDSQTGLLSTRLLRNPLIGDGDAFEDISIALPGLHNGSASWADYDRDGDLDLAITGAQGTEQLPYLQIFENTTSERLETTDLGEAPFIGMLNRQPDQPAGLSYTWEPGVDSSSGSVKLKWEFSHLLNDDAPYTYNLGLSTKHRLSSDAVFDVLSPLSNPASGERLIAAPGNQGFHNAGLFSSGLPGETYHWSVQAIDAGMRSSGWSDGESFTLQPLVTDSEDHKVGSSSLQHFSSSPDQPIRSSESLKEDLESALKSGLDFYMPEIRSSLESLYRVASPEFLKDLVDVHSFAKELTQYLARDNSFNILRKLLAKAFDSRDELLLASFVLSADSKPVEEAYSVLRQIESGATTDTIRSAIKDGTLYHLLSDPIISSGAKLSEFGLPALDAPKVDSEDIKQFLALSERYLPYLIDGSVVALRQGLELDEPELLVAANVLSDMLLLRTYLVNAESELLFNVQYPASVFVDNPLLAEYSSLSSDSYQVQLDVDLDQDGLSDLIRFDESTLQIHVEQNDGSNAYKPFVGPAMVHTIEGVQVEDTFLASLPDDSADVHLSVVDRSFVLADAKARWTLSSVDGDDVSTLTSFTTNAEVDLEASHSLRQRYQLTDQPHGVDLFLNGVNLVSDVPSVLDNDGNVLIAASSTNISFTLEDLRSGSIRALFNGKQDLNDAESSSVSLSLRPLNGASAELYQLQVEDLGDGRPDLLVRWREGSVVSGSLIENASVHTNHVPTPPQLHSLDLLVDSDSGFSGINGSFSLGTDQESALTLSDHQLIFSIEDIDGVVHTRQLALTSSLLIAGSDDHFLITETHPVFDGLQPKSIELQLQVIDAGHLTSLSVPLAVDVPAPPAVDDRPHLELPHGIRLSEGDTLEHLGHGLIPLLLRDRELTIDLPSDSGFAVADAQSIVLTVPAWILEVGQFTDVDGIPLDSGVFTDQDGTALDFDSLHNYDLVGIQLTHDTLNTLCYQPYRTATGRAPLSLQFQQTLDYQGSASNPVTLTQPLELRFRDGGDRIPSTSSGVFPSDPVEGDVWTLDFPVNTRLIDGVSGRELSLVDSNGYVDGYALLPGWQELFGGIGSASDLQLDVSPTTISARGHYSRSFIDSLQVLEADLSSSDDVITLTYSPATGESDISHALSLGAEELLIQTSDGATSFLPIDAHLNSALDAESSATPQALGWVMNDPIVISSDRSLQLPTLIENSDYSVELNRVDLGADDDDAVLTGSIADGLNLVLPQQDQASAVYTLDVSSSDFEMTEQFGALLSIAPGSFGVNALADGMLLAVSHDGLHGLSSPLWMRWTSASSRVVAPVEPAQAEQPSASSDPAPEPPEPSYQVDVVAGFQFFATENDALNRNPIERNTAALDLSVLGDFQLQYQSPAGHYQAYELCFTKDGITVPSVSDLVSDESGCASAVLAELVFSAADGAAR